MTWTGVAVEVLAMTCRDKFPVDVKFISLGRYVDLPSGALGALSLKVPGSWSGVVRATGGQWTKTGVGKDAVYGFFLRLDTVELLELFAGEPSSVDLAMELEWSYGAPSVRSTSVPVPVVVSNDYIRENDGVPVEAIDRKATQAEAEEGLVNDKWMTPLRVAQAAAKILGGSDGSGGIAVIDAGVY